MPILTPEERVGTTIAGKYRLERVLGEGGFGAVLGGVHEWTARPIAVKVLDYSLVRKKGFTQRFLREARAAAKLDHPNVVKVVDMGREPDGTVYMVLELLRGTDLAARLNKRGKLSVETTLELLLPVMDALATAHTQGIIHRDLKPANIFLSVDSRRQTVPKVLDFGIAKDTGDGEPVTKTGEIWGTPHYMSPEQASGRRDLGPAADVWSMGVVLFECLAGSRPFDGDSVVGVLTQVLQHPAPTLSSVAPHVPAAIAEVVDRALLANLDERYATMGELLAALLSAAEVCDILPPSGRALIESNELRLNPTEAAIVADPDSTEEEAATVVTPSFAIDATQVTPSAPHVAEGGATEVTPIAATPTAQPVPPRRPKLALLLGLAGTILLGVVAGAVYAVSDDAATPEDAETRVAEPPPDVPRIAEPPAMPDEPPTDAVAEEREAREREAEVDAPQTPSPDERAANVTAAAEASDRVEDASPLATSTPTAGARRRARRGGRGGRRVPRATPLSDRPTPTGAGGGASRFNPNPDL